MTKIKFNKLVNYVNAKSSVNLRNIANQMAIYVFYISHPCTFRKIREIFGISKSFIWKIILRIAKVVFKIAENEFKLLNSNEFGTVSKNFL